ncbi:hypothetical protein AWB76_06561 [Caballeronia temeraria]|uniref:Uncharacterized protein n=1 Tax=Caballeronia temeraria TaxID=1777137 RepID=A0A158D7M0_9BURK|nr:hypothetical protein AWB76_06561 [Caballeronia temeraria]
MMVVSASSVARNGSALDIMPGTFLARRPTRAVTGKPSTTSG